MLLCAAETHGKLLGLKVERRERRAVGDLEKLPEMKANWLRGNM